MLKSLRYTADPEVHSETILNLAEHDLPSFDCTFLPNQLEKPSVENWKPRCGFCSLAPAAESFIPIVLATDFGLQHYVQ